jgi:hypothetical protein
MINYRIALTRGPAAPDLNYNPTHPGTNPTKLLTDCHLRSAFAPNCSRHLLWPARALLSRGHSASHTCHLRGVAIAQHELRCFAESASVAAEKRSVCFSCQW